MRGPSLLAPRALARVVGYAALAAAIQWRWRRTLWTLAPAAFLASVLYAGKIFVPARHPTLADLLLGVVGGIAGCLVIRALHTPATTR